MIMILKILLFSVLSKKLLFSKNVTLYFIYTAKHTIKTLKRLSGDGNL